MNPKDLNINITSKLHTTEEQQQKMKNFIKALNELPKTIDLKVSLNDGETWGEGIKFDLWKFIGQLYFSEDEN